LNKPEYIKQLKRLIKKYHPDLCGNSYLESMYNEITRILVNKLNEIKLNEKIDNNANTSKDEVNIENDYVLYKSGIKYYRNIHPGKFYKRNKDSTSETKSYNEFLQALNKIYLSFNLSRHFFSRIVNEYPQSPYYDDSKAKIGLLKKLQKSYENIDIEENKIVSSEKFMNEMGLKVV